MTRINTIDVKDLTDQHLMAEYRELPMVHGSARRSLASKIPFKDSRIPKEYTLNTGHVMFFYNKGGFLLSRYKQLIAELERRGYNIDPGARSVDWNVFNNYWFDKWEPTQRDHKINIDRILQRVSEKPTFYTMHKKKINVETYNRRLAKKYGDNSAK